MKNEYDSGLTRIKEGFYKKLSAKMLRGLHHRIGVAAPKKAKVFTFYKLTAVAAILGLITGALLKAIDH